MSTLGPLVSALDASTRWAGLLFVFLLLMQTKPRRITVMTLPVSAEIALFGSSLVALALVMHHWQIALLLDRHFHGLRASPDLFQADARALETYPGLLNPFIALGPGTPGARPGAPQVVVAGLALSVVPAFAYAGLWTGLPFLCAAVADAATSKRTRVYRLTRAVAVIAAATTSYSVYVLMGLAADIHESPIYMVSQTIAMILGTAFGCFMQRWAGLLNRALAPPRAG